MPVDNIALNWADYAMLAIIAISVVISLIRGFTKEALSLAGWIAAAWIGLTYANNFQPYLQDYIEVPSIRYLVSMISLFIVSLFIAAFINSLVSQLVKKTGLSGTDRMIGVLFGVARGCVVIAILVMVGGMTALPSDPWWQQSHFIHYFEQMAVYIRDMLPADFATNINFTKI